MNTTLTIEQFAHAISRTTSKDLSFNNEIRNITISLLGEVGELANITKKKLFHGHPTANQTFLDEVGDILFYLTWLTKTLKLDPILDTPDIKQIWDRKFTYNSHEPNFADILFNLVNIMDNCKSVDLINQNMGSLRSVLLKMFIKLNTLCSSLRLEGSLAHCAYLNQEKLKKRYPDGFSSEASLQRDL